MLVAALRWRLSGLYSHLEVRTCAVYWEARAPRVFAALNARPNDRLLEIGCGRGTWTSYLTGRVGHLTALDVDEASVAAVREWKAPRQPLRPAAAARLLVGSAERLPFLDSTFSRVLSVDVIEHVPDDAAAVREIARVLRPGGRAVLTTLRVDRPHYLRRVEFPDHKREYTPERLTTLFREEVAVEQTFDFYFAPSMLARELQVAVEQRFRRGPSVRALALGLFLRGIAAIDRLVPLGRPAGVGVVAVKRLD